MRLLRVKTQTHSVLERSLQLHTKANVALLKVVVDPHLRDVRLQLKGMTRDVPVYAAGNFRVLIRQTRTPRVGHLDCIKAGPENTTEARHKLNRQAWNQISRLPIEAHSVARSRHRNRSRHW